MLVRPLIFVLAIGLLGLPFGVVGCGDGSERGGLWVEVDFDPGMPRSARDEAMRVEVYVVSSCEGISAGERPASSVASTYVLRDGGGPPFGNGLDPGDYAVHALAKDANCAVVATGCEPVSVGPDGQGGVTVTLSSFAGNGCSSSQRCVLETGDCMGTGGTGGAGGAGGTDECRGADDETPCMVDDVAGVCRMDICCTGCWDGATCHPGNKTQACGTGGELCRFEPGCSS